ncbi:hypothetical protein EAG_10710 [Camponotus floridanus]|uniref:Uncharacterized protein n=1 Tax=Camponotus floridanus TaxID=104421 RepID=E2AEK2_CAMFO|nr:hypothetical protein EAG_10710 [Camponotus floridanus]
MKEEERSRRTGEECGQCINYTTGWLGIPSVQGSELLLINQVLSPRVLKVRSQRSRFGKNFKIAVLNYGGFTCICEEARFEDLSNCYFILGIDVIETIYGFHVKFSNSVSNDTVQGNTFAKRNPTGVEITDYCHSYAIIAVLKARIFRRRFSFNYIDVKNWTPMPKHADNNVS